MQIKRLRNTHFGTKKISRVVTGWALQSILDAGGFSSFEGMEYVQELAA